MIGRGKAFIHRHTRGTDAGGTPRWRSPLRLGFALFALLVVAIPLVWVVVGGSARLSARERTTLEVVSLVIMLALTVASLAQLNGAVLDLIFLRSAAAYGRTVPALDWVVAYHELETAVYRALGKLFLVIDMGLLVLAANDVVRLWLARHPLLLAVLILEAMVIFTIVDVLTFFYRRGSRRIPAPLSLESVLEGIGRRLTTAEGQIATIQFVIRETVLPMRDLPDDEEEAVAPDGAAEAPPAAPDVA